MKLDLHAGKMRRTVFGTLLFACTTVVFSDFATASPLPWRTVMLEMQDGTKLSTYYRKPLLQHDFGAPVATVLDRSPYGHLGLELLAQAFPGMAGVSQDMRGTHLSGGAFDVWHSAAADGNATLEWISKQRWSNGTTFTIGASADGIGSMLIPLAQPTSLQAQFIIFATSEAHSTFYPGGAYRKSLIEGWLKGTVSSQADALIAQVKENEARNAWWDQVEFTEDDFSVVRAPAVHWAGWYDIFARGHLAAFRGFQELSKVPERSWLFVDACGHCQDAAKLFGDNTFLHLGRSTVPILLALHLFRSGGDGLEARSEALGGVDRVTFYVMGQEAANYWTSLPEFPPHTPTPLYLFGDGTARYEAPSLLSSEVPSARTFESDPSNPVPTIGGNNLILKCGPLDQREAEQRDDVLVFTTEPLEVKLALTGPVDAEIFLSSTAVDTDVVVKLTDVYPDGRSILLLDGIARLRWRGDEREPFPATPGEVYPYTVSLCQFLNQSSCMHYLYART